MSEVRVAGDSSCAWSAPGTEFSYSEIKLNTSGVSFMNLDWANKSGTGVICDACGFVHTFAQQVEWHHPDRS